MWLFVNLVVLVWTDKVRSVSLCPLGAYDMVVAS